MRFWNCWISIGCHPVSHYPTQSDLLFSSCNCLFFQTKATVSIQSYLKGQYREPVSRTFHPVYRMGEENFIHFNQRFTTISVVEECAKSFQR
jgi:hypothetical protein